MDLCPRHHGPLVLSPPENRNGPGHVRWQPRRRLLPHHVRAISAKTRMGVDYPYIWFCVDSLRCPCHRDDETTDAPESQGKSGHQLPRLQNPAIHPDYRRHVQYRFRLPHSSGIHHHLCTFQRTRSFFRIPARGILNGASVLRRALPGFIAERWGRNNVMILSSSLVLGMWLSASSNVGHRRVCGPVLPLQWDRLQPAPSRGF